MHHNKESRYSFLCTMNAAVESFAGSISPLLFFSSSADRRWRNAVVGGDFLTAPVQVRNPAPPDRGRGKCCRRLLLQEGKLNYGGGERRREEEEEEDGGGRESFPAARKRKEKVGDSPLRIRDSVTHITWRTTTPLA